MNRAQRRKAVKTEPRASARYEGGPVTCDVCTKLFTPRPYEEPSPEGGVTSSFRCPSCGRRYVVAHIDERGLELRRELAEYGAARDEVSIPERVERVRALKAEMRKHIWRPR